MKNMNYMDVMGYAMERMSGKGVFLTAPGEPANTMTIGWGWIGYCWGKPVFVAVVRPQRHTYGLIEKAGCFTVSVPTDESLREQLMMAGTKSGRDMDKFSGTGLTAVPGQKVDAPIIAECGLHFECRTVLADDMPADSMEAEILRKCYPMNDLHRMYFGEIVACYATDEEFAEKYAR